MSQFLLCDAIDEDGNHVDYEANIFEMSDEEFIGNTEFDESVSRNYTDAVEDSFSDFDFDQEPNNYCNENEVSDLSIDEFKDYKKKLIVLKKL